MTLPVMCDEMDNLASGTATGPHEGEHMVRMRMETHEYRADVSRGREQSKAERKRNLAICCLITVDGLQQATSFCVCYIMLNV